MRKNRNLSTIEMTKLVDQPYLSNPCDEDFQSKKSALFISKPFQKGYNSKSTLCLLSVNKVSASKLPKLVDNQTPLNFMSKSKPSSPQKKAALIQSTKSELRYSKP